MPARWGWGCGGQCCCGLGLYVEARQAPCAPCHRPRRPGPSACAASGMTSFCAPDLRKDSMFRLSPMGPMGPLPLPLGAVPALSVRPRPVPVCGSHPFPVPTEDNCQQRFAEFHPMYDGVIEAWPPGSPAPLWRRPGPGPAPAAAKQTLSAAGALAPGPPPLTPSPLPLLPPLPFFPSDEPCIFSEWRDSCPWREADPGSPSPSGTAVATPHGTMSLRLHDRVRVDMSVDRAIRVINLKNNIVLALGATGSSAALLHPNGRTYQYGSRVEILAHDSRGNNKFAKMWYKGVSFTSEQCALVYLVDTAGTRTTTDNFSDMSQDLSLSVFYNDSRHGPACVSEAISLLESGQYWVTDEGVENWLINGVRVSQTADGLVRVARNSNKYQVRTSPSNGSASLTTPFLHCTASLGQTSHLFVRRGERRMHYDGASFIVRNAGHSAGFDEKNQLKVY
ncbi:putative global transcription activator SNF2L2 [Frankliniella fusca]|uniref:Global transcription activator SNF2L2 n=1 Tax=Frankliniella fusca TaxID=407009 RepID=A0AAE1LP70_9NEOP|nr:putative global transcription activator SNF2L2 [Frankliniella fusca]